MIIRQVVAGIFRLPGFGGGPSMPAPPPPPPTREDPAIADAKKQLRMSEAQRRGRRASILTPPEDQLGATTLDRPSGATTLGS
jgi:hypothetical protein